MESQNENEKEEREWTMKTVSENQEMKTANENEEWKTKNGAWENGNEEYKNENERERKIENEECRTNGGVKDDNEEKEQTDETNVKTSSNDIHLKNKKCHNRSTVHSTVHSPQLGRSPG